jgi:hypothetical protein
MMIGIATIFSEWNRLLLTNKVAAAYGTNMNATSVFSLFLPADDGQIRSLYMCTGDGFLILRLCMYAGGQNMAIQ